MAQPNFGAILDTPADEIERPKPLPIGTYDCIVSGMPRLDKSSKKQTEFAEFTLNLINAGEDVDADELRDWGGIAGKSIKNTYYLTDSSIFRLKDFLTHCGIETEGKSLRAAMEEAPNKPVRVYIKHEPSDDGESVFARVGKTMPVD